MFGHEQSAPTGALTPDDDFSVHFGSNVLNHLEGPLVKHYKQWASTAQNATPIVNHTAWLVPEAPATKQHVPEKLGRRAEWPQRKLDLMRHMLNEESGFGAEVTGKEQKPSGRFPSKGYATNEWMKRYIGEFGFSGNQY